MSESRDEIDAALLSAAGGASGESCVSANAADVVNNREANTTRLNFEDFMVEGSPKRGGDSTVGGYCERNHKESVRFSSSSYARVERSARKARDFYAILMSKAKTIWKTYSCLIS